MNQPQREANNSHSSSVGVKNGWSCTSSNFTCFRDVGRDKIVFFAIRAHIGGAVMLCTPRPILFG